MDRGHHAILHRTEEVEMIEFGNELSDEEVTDLFIERFGVDDARDLVRTANSRPVKGQVRLLVIRTTFITLEAQNALLKVLEEPPVSTRFIFIVPFDLVVLPTLISRFAIAEREGAGVVFAHTKEFDSFRKLGYKDRLLAIEDAVKKRDTAWQRSIKQGLIQYVSQLAGTDTRTLAELEFVARLLLTRGASNKLLLEHAALIIPGR